MKKDPMKDDITKYLAISLLTASSAFAAHAQGAYDFSKLKMENLGRGVSAVRTDKDNVAVSWRYLPADPGNQAFDVYCNGKKINSAPVTESTFITHRNKGEKESVYEVRPLKGGAKGSYTLSADAPVGYLPIPIDKPELGVEPFGKEYFYSANDASVGDVDGDGEYEIILKWDPTNSHDNAHNGFTGPTFIDCYKLDGTKLWRIDLGDNIRSGAHYIHPMVYDLDGDGKAEVVLRTADGTSDAAGRVIGDKRADWRNMKGRIMSGPEYLTIFNGATGEIMQTIDFQPERGNVKDWGDGYANRSDRFLAAIAYLDGVHPSVVMCRGYYAKTVLAAYDWDGNNLKLKWIFDSTKPGNEAYGGQGNHNLRVADVDRDGCDEIIYGQMTVDNDGTGLYSTGMYHGDAMHLVPDVAGEKYYIWGCHENRKDGSSMRDAETGRVIFQFESNKDIGRCMAADIDPTSPGIEVWSPNTGGVRSFTGELVSPKEDFINEMSARTPVNFAVWWDGDLLREMLDKNVVSKYDWTTGKCNPLLYMEGATWNNGTKANPCISADILGDWREEVLMRTPDSSELRLYMTPYPTDYRFHSFMSDPVYRVSVANENVAYNQPPEPGFYFGPDMKKGSKVMGTVIK